MALLGRVHIEKQFTEKDGAVLIGLLPAGLFAHDFEGLEGVFEIVSNMPLDNSIELRYVGKPASSMKGHDFNWKATSFSECLLTEEEFKQVNDDENSIQH